MPLNKPFRSMSVVGILAVLPALAGCDNSSSSGSVEFATITAPASVSLGGPLAWSVPLNPGEQARTTVRDANNSVVFVRDYEPIGDFEWTPFQSGVKLIEIEIRDGSGKIAEGEALVEVLPRGAPMVSGTAHPLVALYTLEIPEGLQASVRYTCETCPPEVIARTFETPLKDGVGGVEMGVLLPGLRANTTYTVQHTLYEGNLVIERGPELSHTSGALGVAIPAVEIPAEPVNPGINALLTVTPIAGDLHYMLDVTGEPVWYMPAGGLLTRPTGDGWAVLRDTAPGSVDIVDFTGQSIRRTTPAALNLQLEELGVHPITTVHHEIRPLPGGLYAVLTMIEKEVIDQQGPGPVLIIGDGVLVLDEEMRVIWAWDAFDHMDASRAALLGDTWPGASGDLLPDWLHSNSIDYDPKDGNLILSVRHQDWVVKIAYEDGDGDGHVVWRLGNEGDFTIVADDPQPWFSYQHDANILEDGRLAIYDNGNVRTDQGASGNSRGQVFILDEISMIALLDVNIDMGVYSGFLGSAGLTADGSFHFNNGGQALHDTVAANGFLHSTFQTTSGPVYRSFRMSDPFDTTQN